jgi:hypothetical protein
MRTRIIILLLILFPAGKILLAQSPELTSESTISLLTCGPGPEIYSYFGHSALRVTDPVLKIDRVYNYGTFDFNIPDFYAKFIDGKMYYMLSVVRYQGFAPDYIAENRFIKELVLNIPLEVRNELFRLLEINYLPENRHYWYDFFRDNCSTRIRDIVIKATNGQYEWPDEPEERLTYRQLIMPYISLNNWAKTGILLLLTAGADEESDQHGYMFLPDHMHRLFSQAQLTDGTPLCKPEKILYMPEYPTPKGTGLLHPYFIFSFVLIMSLVVFFVRTVPSWLRKSWFVLLLVLSGLMGILFSYMWFFSGHVVCHANLNLAWAFPLNIILALTIWWPKINKLNQGYIRVMILITALFLLTFAFWQQRIPLEAILFSLALLAGFLSFAGFNILRKGKPDDHTN